MKTHTGSCHCKKVQYEVDLDLSETGAIDCNCSHCANKGLLLRFVQPEAFTLKSGEDTLQEYRFNTKKIQHLFCKDCGVQAFSNGVNKEGERLVAINVRSLDDVDVAEVPRKPVDGKSY